ncbi:MAG: NUDIX domain-containing protein [Rhodobacteraceae bacterium]|nr:NUDIX domain-containing protein [Paracoccaceae bacterium]
MKQTALAAFRTLVEPVFKRPEFVQTAALCTRQGRKGVEVLLVTSLDTKRWIVPKGWPMEGRSLAQAAAQEAWEEAGVRGVVDENPIGSFGYEKTVKGGIPVTCRCSVYRIETEALAEDYPEKGRRERRWMRPRDAARAVDERELKAVIRALD